MIVFNRVRRGNVLRKILFYPCSRRSERVCFECFDVFKKIPVQTNALGNRKFRVCFGILQSCFNRANCFRFYCAHSANCFASLLSEYVALIKDYKRTVPLFLRIFGSFCFRMFILRPGRSRKMCFAACNGRRFFAV